MLLARQLTALHHDRYIAPFHQLYAWGFLIDEPRSPVPRADDAVREALAAHVPG